MTDLENATLQQMVWNMTDKDLAELVGLIARSGKVYIPNWFIRRMVNGTPPDALAFCDFCEWVYESDECDLQSERFQDLFRQWRT